MKLLHIDSSIQGELSASRALTREIVSRWQAARPDVQVTYRDLAAQELPHLSHKALSQADELEAPMYNFSIPSQLKAWIDRITVKGRTFRYTERGPEGLAGGKEVIVAVSRGGVYAPNAPGEFGESYLRFLFGFLGVRDVSFVRAEGLGLSPQHREAGIAAALATIAGPAALAA
jgi:FMN-dependent NADH-azoreductase